MGRRKIAAIAVLVCAALALALLIVAYMSSCFLGGVKSEYKNALYIYMCGSTLETKSATATKSINEMLESNIPADTAIIIETGGARKWRGYDVPNDALVYYRVQNGQLIELERKQNANMGDAQTLSSFLNFCNENYPAQNSNLLFWNHGAGSVKGVCLDENNELDGLSAAELSQALDETNSHFNNVCFDACLMANFETMRAVSNHANTMIASQELEPAAGWNYKSLIENLDSADFDTQALLSYKDECEDKGKLLWTLSAIDLDKFAQVESALDSFCNEVLSKKAQENNLQAVVQAAKAAMSFGEQNGKSNFVDLSQFAEKLEYNLLTQAIKNCTQAENGQDRQGASGMSIYFPLSFAQDVKEYLASETNETYKRFLGTNFQSNKTGKTIELLDEGSIRTQEGGSDASGDGSSNGGGADSNGGGGSDSGANTTGAEDSGSEGGDSDSSSSGNGGADTSFVFKVAPSCVSEIQSVVYDIYKLNDDAPATSLGFDNDIISSGNGEFSIAFSGKWVYLNGNILSCEPIDSVGDTTVFSSPVKLNDVEGNLRFTYNSKTRAFSLQGFVAREQDQTQGRLEDINPGDKITILSATFLSEDSTETEFSEIATITADDNLELSTMVLPDGDYQIYGIIIDLYGNEVTTKDYIIKLENGKIVDAYVADPIIIN